MRQPYRHVVVFFNEVYNYGTCYTRNSATILSFFFDSDSWKFSICQVKRMWFLLRSSTKSILESTFQPVPEDLPVSIPEKQQFLLRHHIAVWDVIASCEIHGSSDSSIKNALPNDLSVILSHACIRQIFCNGTTSWKLYQKYMKPQYAVDAVKLPSTSPANAAFSLERLTEEWSVILPYLKNPS